MPDYTEPTYPCRTGSTSPGLKTEDGIPYALGCLEGDVQRIWDQTSSMTTARIVCNWEDASEFAKEMMGYSKLLGTGGTAGAKLSRVLPERCPLNDSQYCHSLKIIQTTGFNPEPTDKFQGWPEFSKDGKGAVVFQATYLAPLYPLFEDEEVVNEHQRFCIITPRGVAENEKIPGGAFYTVDASKDPIPETSVKTGRSIDLGLAIQ